MSGFHQWGYLKGNVPTAVQNQIGGVNKDILKTADAYLQRNFLSSPCEYNKWHTSIIVCILIKTV